MLNGALALLTRPEAWCQGAGARDAAGDPVSPLDPAAVSWCVMGAVARAAGGETDAYWAADELLHELVNGTSLSAVNDDVQTAHDEIVGLLWRGSLTSLMEA